MTQKTETIPLMDEFDEGSLLDQIKTPGDEETPEEEAARIAAEEAEKETPEEKETREKLELEEKETPEEKEIRLAKEQEDELTDEEKEALKSKKDKDEGSFWGDVEAITGNPVEVEYGEVSPDSPEGAALREEVVIKQGIENNLASLEKNYPRSFQALQHEANGGKFEDLLGEKTTNYAAVTLDEENSVQLKSVLKNYYLDKGLTEAKAQRMVEVDEDSDEGLFVNAEAALKEQKELEASKEAKVIEDQAEVKRLQGEQDKNFSNNLSDIISEGKIGNFKIDKKDAESFYSHVLSQVQRTGDGYSLSVPLNKDNLTEQLQQLFFGFKKGDLSKFVLKTAKSENVRTLKRSLKKEKSAEEVAIEKRKTGSKLSTMHDFEAE